MGCGALPHKTQRNYTLIRPITKLFSIFIFFLSFSLFAENSIDNANKHSILLYKQALNYENQEKFNKAIEFYEKHIQTIKNKDLIEKINLKIARITPEYKDAVKKYKDFLSSYPGSYFKFLARYELACLHKLNGKYNEAIEEYRLLSKISKGTLYWQKAIMDIALLEYKNDKYDSAIRNINNVLKHIDDYEEVGKAYYLLGKIMLKQGLHEDAERFFLICAGSFPQSSKAAASLFELMNVYILTGKYLEAKRIAAMISQLYADSPENHEASQLLKKISNNIKEKRILEVELINLNEDHKIEEKFMKKLRGDLKLSLLIYDIKNLTDDDNRMDYPTTNTNQSLANIYIQLGYFSTLETAKRVAKKYKDLGVNNVYHAKTRSSKNTKVFYRVIIGPFNTKKEANKELIELKEKNIESIILELTKSYD